MSNLNLSATSKPLKLLIATLAAAQLLTFNAYAEEPARDPKDANAGPAEAKSAENKEPESPWDISYTLSFVSDYLARDISQTYLAPTPQASIDLTHESSFYAGVWASEVTNNSNAGGH